jgi:hypothetical protein
MILMDVLPVLIAHLIHNGKLNPLRKDVAIGLNRAGKLIQILGKYYYNSVGSLVCNELIASGVTVDMLEEVLESGMIFEETHPTKAYKWDQYGYTSNVSQCTSMRKNDIHKILKTGKAELKVGDVQESNE